MCLLVLAWRVHPRYKLVVAANRDEFHDRPAAPFAPWADPPGLHAGKDLRAGGTWLGIDPAARVGIVTNFRELQRPRRSAPSRGGLIPAYFAASKPPREYLAAIEVDAPAYSGFNLLLADRDELWYASNRADVFARPLPAAVYGLSNHFLDTPWPKLLRAREAFEAELRAAEPAPHALLSLLADRRPAEPDDAERDPRERALSAPFVLHPQYGTRCSTVLMIPVDGPALALERRFDARGETIGESEFTLSAAR